MSNTIDLALVSSQYPISPSSFNPPSATVHFDISGAPPFEVSVPLCKGNMRLHFNAETTSRITEALREGRSIDIFVDDLSVTVHPEQFAKIYEKFMGSAAFFKNPLKGS